MILENLRNIKSKGDKMMLPAQWEGWAKATLFNVVGELFKFPETPSPKPARIPPQTPPAGGTGAEAGRIHIPSQMFRPAESILVSRVLRKMGSNFFKQTPPKLVSRLALDCPKTPLRVKKRQSDSIA
mgnify:CR=1 FL=1